MTKNPALVKCPFFVGFGNYCVKCDGVCGAKETDVTFKFEFERNDHIEQYCQSIKNYHKCPIADMLIKQCK